MLLIIVTTCHFVNIFAIRPSENAWLWVIASDRLQVTISKEERRLMKRESKENQQTPKGVNAQVPTLHASITPETRLSLALHQRAWRAVFSLYQYGHDVSHAAQARTKAFFAEINYNRAKSFLADQAPKIEAWKLHLEFTPPSASRPKNLCVKMVYDTSDMDLYGFREHYTAVICESDQNTWFCLETFDMDIINVVQITPSGAEEILSKVTNAMATVAAYETVLNVPANNGATANRKDKTHRMDDFHP